MRTKFRTKAEAKQELDRLRNDDGATSAHVEKLTVRKLFDDYIRTKEVAGRAPATIAGLRWAADIACERWGSMSAERLTHDHLDAAYADMLVTGRRVFYCEARPRRCRKRTVIFRFNIAVRVPGN